MLRKLSIKSKAVNSTFVCSAFNKDREFACIVPTIATNPLKWCNTLSVFGALAKLQKATISFAMSLCPHGKTRLPLDGFS